MTVDPAYKDFVLAPTNKTNYNLGQTWKDHLDPGTYAAANVSRCAALTQTPIPGIDRSAWPHHISADVAISTHGKFEQALQNAYHYAIPAVLQTNDED